MATADHTKSGLVTGMGQSKVAATALKHCLLTAPIAPTKTEGPPRGSRWGFADAEFSRHPLGVLGSSSEGAHEFRLRYDFFCHRRSRPRPARALPNKTRLAGSGTEGGGG